MEKRLDDIQEEANINRHYRKVNSHHISKTDPEAGIVRCGRPKLYYKTHRAVEGHSEVITAVEVTAGDINEAHHMESLWKLHEKNTEQRAKTIVADSKYGTKENYLYCNEHNIQAHIPDLKGKLENKKKREIFSEGRFIYDAELEAYICPASKLLKRSSFVKSRNSYEYRATKKQCEGCHLRDQCTKSKRGRSVKRHINQEELDIMRARASTFAAKKDIHTRQHLMERSFAKSTRYSFDRARWRGNWRVSIQELLTCTIENIQILMKPRIKRKHVAANRVKQEIRIKAFYKPIFANFHTHLSILWVNFFTLINKTVYCNTQNPKGTLSSYV